MKLFNQSATLLIAVSFVLSVLYTPLVSYLAPILAFLIVVSVIYIIMRQRQGKRQIFSGSNAEVFVITAALLVAIFLTGGLASNLFFLLYILIFGVIFLFDARTVFVLLAGLIVLFIPSLTQGELGDNLIKLASLALITPLSYFLGLELARRGKIRHDIKDKTGRIIEDAEALRAREFDETRLDEIEDIEENAFELRKKTPK